MSNKFTFSYEHYDSFGEVAKTYNLTTNEVSLMALIEDFETFLKGSGFVFDGILDIIEPESMEISPQDQAEMDAMFPVGGDSFPPMEPFDTAVNKTTTHSNWYYDTERNK
jgi:hypothetical protein